MQRCNSEFERMIGYGPGELLGQSAPLPVFLRILKWKGKLLERQLARTASDKP